MAQDLSEKQSDSKQVDLRNAHLGVTQSSLSMLSQIRSVACAPIHFLKGLEPKEWAAFAIPAALMTVCLYFHDSKFAPAANWGLIGFSGLFLTSYVALLFSLIRHLQVRDSELKWQDLGFAFIYCIIWILTLTYFAWAWYVFGNFGPAGGGEKYKPEIIDALYFSAVIFSTVGFGDFVPTNSAGKLFFTFQVLIGSIHLVVFFSLLLTKRR
jgi:hypothetical protein